MAWQQDNAFRRVPKVKPSAIRAIQVTLNVANTCVGVRHASDLIDLDSGGLTTISRVYRERKNERKYSVSGGRAEENVSLMSGVRAQSGQAGWRP